jgi:hypothetical protein
VVTGCDAISTCDAPILAKSTMTTHNAHTLGPVKAIPTGPDHRARRTAMTRPRLVRPLAAVSAGALLASLAFAPVTTLAAASPVADVSVAAHHDVSPPLRNLRPSAPSAANLRERPLLRPGGPGGNAPDGALQTTTSASIATTTGLSFAGVGQGDYGFSDRYAPPDTNGAVGATQYVQWVNTDFAIFNKSTGAIVYGPVAANTLWSGFGGGCQANNDGDPIVRYDAIAQRWIFTQFSVSTTPYLQCVAVSTTSDATGSYYRYSFSFGTTAFPDYPKLGVWPDAYYMSFNIFNNGSTWAGARACALDRNAMVTGAAATMQCFQLSTAYPSLLPADLDGTTTPPSGSPGFFLDYTGTSTLNLWKFRVDFSNPANTRFTGPTPITVASFSAACGGGTCIPQPSTTQKLDSLADRLMYRLAYRNFGDHESMVVNQSVTAGTSTGIRWYELRNPSGSTMAAGTPIVYQQGTYAPDSAYRWMGSIAMDKAGDIAVGYSVSSSSTYPSIRYTGRVPTDTLNTMEAETSVKAGSGSQLQNLSRWGDYSAMSVDPVDGCTFWYTNEYLKGSGTFNWSTWITSFRFPNCGSTTQAPAITSANSAGFTVGTAGSFTVTATGSPTPALTESGTLPGGVTFVDNGNGTATLSGTPTSASAGTYALTITASNGVSPNASQPFTLTVASSTQALVVTTASLPDGTVNTPYGATLQATGGTTPYTWSISSGALPSGLTLDSSSGTISGTPSVAGTFTFTVTVSDSSTPTAQTASQNLSVTVSQASTATVPSAPQNVAAAGAKGKGVQLAWQTPASDGGSAITGYIVYRGTTSAGELPLTTLGVVTSYKDTSTRRGVTYYYEVAAVNSVGTGPKSNEASAVAK